MTSPILHHRLWWIDKEANILGGMFPGSIIPHLVREHTVSAYLNLQEPNETNFEGRPFRDYLQQATQLADSRPAFLRVQIPDMSIPFSAREMDRALDFLCEASPKQTTYVHCWGGHGRTGLVAACYLKCIRGLSVNDALKQIALARSHSPYLRSMPSPQTSLQLDFVRHYNYGGMSNDDFA